VPADIRITVFPVPGPQETVQDAASQANTHQQKTRGVRLERKQKLSILSGAPRSTATRFYACADDRNVIHLLLRFETHVYTWKVDNSCSILEKKYFFKYKCKFLPKNGRKKRYFIEQASGKEDGSLPEKKYVTPVSILGRTMTESET
jgi:hypothetical protein